MFFVLSSGRSGSLTIAQALDGYGNCKCYHHNDPQFIIEATQYYYGKYSGDKIAEMLKATRPDNSKAIMKKQYGEVNLQFSLLVPVLERVFQDSKYIWLIRDGRDVVASMCYRRWYDPEDSKVPDEWKRGRLQGDLTGDFSPDEWKNTTRFAKCCWLWKKYNLIIESHLQKLDKNRWMIVRLDRLRSTFPQIAQFLGLVDNRRALVEKLNEAYQPVSYWEDWDHGKRKVFESYCGDIMDLWFPEWKNESGVWMKIKPEVPDKPGLLLRLKRIPGNARVKAWEIKRNIMRRLGSLNKIMRSVKKYE